MNNEHTYPMNNHANAVGFCAGMIGGFMKYLASVQTEIFARMIEAGVTALFCGFLGMAGKELYGYIKKKYLKRKK